MSVTPNLLLELVPQGSFEPWVAVNDALIVLDAIAQLSPEDKDATAPPATVAGDAGKTWIVAAGATGAWAGHAGSVAICTGADLWRFAVPRVGWRAYVRDEAADYRYTGAGWAAV